MGGFFVRDSWGWVHQYINIIQSRFRNNKLSSIKFLVYISFAMLASYVLLTFGIKYVITILFSPALVISSRFYHLPVIKNLLLTEFLFYIFIRSRLGIQYFPRFSLLITLFIFFSIWMNPFADTLWLVNLHFWLHILMFILMIIM
jgi:hypothetical protein